MGHDSHSMLDPDCGAEELSEGHTCGQVGHPAGQGCSPSRLCSWRHSAPFLGASGARPPPPSPPERRRQPRRPRRRGRCSRGSRPPPRRGAAARRPTPPCPGPPGPARPPRCGSAARRLPHPSAAAASPAERPGPSWPPAGGGPGSPGEAAAARGGESPRGGDGARQPPPERPCRGLCLRCHMGRGAGFKRVSAGHAVSGAPQPCPQRQRSARPGMRL